MKRILISLMLIAMLACTLCGCTKGGNDVTTMTTVDRSQITTTLPTAAPTDPVVPPTEPTAAPDQPIAFTSELHPGLSMMLPASWNGKYAVRESETSVEFYELQNHLYDGSGKLFTLMFMDVNAYEDGMFPSYDVVYQSPSTIVVALYPTDMQTSEEYLDQYTAMSDEIMNITETVQYAE